MNPIRDFINQVEHGSSATLSTETIKSVVLHLQEQPHIDWDDENFYQLPRVLNHISNSWKLKTEDIIFALEPLFALLPDGLRQTKGLLQNSSYTSFAMEVLGKRPEIGARFLHQGMTAGRHLYTDGDNLSFVVQREIFLDVTKIFIENATADQFSELLDVIEQHHEPHMYEKAYQNMLYTLVNGARSGLLEPLLARMSLTSEGKRGELGITRSELMSFEWMGKAPNMNCELYNSVAARHLCEPGGFDDRVWEMADWMMAHVNEKNAGAVVDGISLLADRLCTMDESESIGDISTIRTQEHPIFTVLWSHPDLINFQHHVVEHLLYHVDAKNLPFERGCEMAWMFYERLQDPTRVSSDLLPVLQQYPPYSRHQLECSIESTATARGRKM